MQIRPKTYLHFMSVWRSLRHAIPAHREGVTAETSPSLVYIAVVLALILAVLEVDAHRAALEPLGLFGHDYPIQTPFVGP